jgi:hypothetical protein
VEFAVVIVCVALGLVIGRAFFVRSEVFAELLVMAMLTIAAFLVINSAAPVVAALATLIAASAVAMRRTAG